MENAIKKYWPVFVLPTLLAFAVGFIWPFLQGLYLSFCQFVTIDRATFNGFDNYLFALGEEGFSHAFWFTALFTVISTFCVNAAALAIAVALTRGIKGTHIFRSVFFMPNLIGGIVLGYIWNILINCVLTILKQPLLTLNATYGFAGLIILTCWQQIGYMMIIYIAGLNGIPSDYLEAAQIDGATERQVFWKVKLPNLMPAITICLFLSLTNGFKLFDQNLALTNGDPAHQTEMLALNIYDTFYGRSGPQWKGYGQAKAVLFCILVISLSLIQLRATRAKEVQQ